MQNLDDKQLVSLAKKGNSDALETLVARYLKLVYSFVFTYAKNRDDAEDITQEVFVKVWKHLDKYDAEKEFRPWLYQIAKNTAFDLFKKKSAIPFSEFENEQGDSWLTQGLADSSPQPQILTDRSLLGESLASALKELSPKYSEIISQYHIEELNFREISERSKESINTVKSRYRRAVAKLKEIWPGAAPKK